MMSIHHYWLSLVILFGAASHPTFAAQIHSQFASNTTSYSRVFIAPIACTHYGYNQLVRYNQSEVDAALKALSDRVCSNVMAGLIDTLMAKGYRVNGSSRTLVTEDDWKQLSDETRRAFVAVHNEFGEISRVLHDESKHGSRGQFDFNVGKRIVELRDRLGATDSDVLVLVDERCHLVPVGRKLNDGSVKVTETYLRGIEYNVGLVDLRTGDLLWWNTGRFPDPIGRDLTLINKSVRTVLAKLPVVAAPREKRP